MIEKIRRICQNLNFRINIRILFNQLYILQKKISVTLECSPLLWVKTTYEAFWWKRTLRCNDTQRMASKEKELFTTLPHTQKFTNKHRSTRSYHKDELFGRDVGAERNLTNYCTCSEDRFQQNSLKTHWNMFWGRKRTWSG